jgi:hypothetical protein
MIPSSQEDELSYFVQKGDHIELVIEMSIGISVMNIPSLRCLGIDRREGRRHSEAQKQRLVLDIYVGYLL